MTKKVSNTSMNKIEIPYSLWRQIMLPYCWQWWGKAGPDTKQLWWKSFYDCLGRADVFGVSSCHKTWSGFCLSAMLFVHKDSAGRLEIRMGTQMYHFLHRALLKYTFRTHKCTSEEFTLTFFCFYTELKKIYIYPQTAPKTLNETFLHVKRFIKSLCLLCRLHPIHLLVFTT